MHPIETKIILDEENPIFKIKPDKETSLITVDSILESYILSCAKSLTAITSAIKKTSLSLKMLDKDLLSHIDYDDESLSTYIEILIENSIIRVQLIYDRLLISINNVLNLGISNECINHNSLVTNRHVISFGLADKLKSINKSCNQYRKIRNTVIHHDRYDEEAFNQLKMIISANLLSKQTGKSEIINNETLNILIDDFLKITYKDIDIYLQSITSKIYDLFDNISPIYDFQKSKLR